MGSCVSVHKDSDSLTKLRFSIGSKNEIPSPVKEKPIAVNAGAAVTPLRSPARYSSVGSKDEAFFDSQPWLESDYEDDFLSVNGDFSRGNTPVHPNSSLVNKLPSEEARESPPDKKKRLSELFKESLREEQYDEAPTTTTTTTTLAQQLKSTSGTPDYSGGGCSEQATPNRVVGEDNKSLRSTQCCLPILLSSQSMNERRRSSAAPNGG
ncbi:hypothetical protein SASPL_137562 [Salvia splendens]|uniref:Uncharacterized protein n=1 Tax=Salvia splendens TaxID=180675 RepID=A0A8X8WTJ6_SALSN|nr:uncharacterized protein At3g27210-like [Salvia splendens]KAG6400720.1 hypothetical protein SASPL_137562 [Salvia splendens]